MKKLLLAVGIAAVIGIAWAGRIAALAWRDLDINRIRSGGLSTVICDARGETAYTVFARENRLAADPADIPQKVRDAFLAAEDLRFYRHHGVDIYRLAGAVWKDVTTLSLKQGASTITQQLIKLTCLTPEKTLTRKIREAAMALRLEREMSKDEILLCYLDRVYFGAGAYGIRTAAETYFGKEPSDLTVEEAALLAGILKSPSRYAPHLHADAALERRNAVLGSMFEAGMLSETEYVSARETPVRLRMAEPEAGDWYTDAVMDEACTLLSLSRDELLTGGYRIDTELDPAVQNAAEALFAQDDLFPPDASDGEKAQAAMVVMDSRTGGVKALIGGREYLPRGLDRATQTRRQPGSAIKPVSVYAAAVDAFGYLPADPVRDEARTYDGYAPKNSGGVYHGTVTLREALSSSMNAAAVELAHIVGVDAVREYAQAMGLPLADPDSGYALALGCMTEGVTLTELSSAYAALSNGGLAVPPHLITRITDRNGKTVYRHEKTGRRAISAETAFLITSMLRTAAREGTAKALRDTAFPVAAKTGTVGLADGCNRDAWSVAYTPDTVVCAWMGFDSGDDGHALPAGMTGGTLPTGLVHALLTACPHIGGGEFEMPRTLNAVLLDENALMCGRGCLLASEFTPKEAAVEEYFPEDRLPAAVSTLWTPPEAPVDVYLQDGRLFLTALSAEEEYVILKNGQEHAVLRGVFGQQLSIQAEEDGEYSVYARNADLFLTGVDIRSQSVEP